MNTALSSATPPRPPWTERSDLVAAAEAVSTAWTRCGISPASLSVWNADGFGSERLLLRFAGDAEYGAALAMLREVAAAAAGNAGATERIPVRRQPTYGQLYAELIDARAVMRAVHQQLDTDGPGLHRVLGEKVAELDALLGRADQRSHDAESEPDHPRRTA